MKLSKLSRVLHRWGSIIALLPITIIIFSGIVLQLKKVSPYVQPPTQSGAGTEPAIGFDRILEVARTVPEADTLPNRYINSYIYKLYAFQKCNKNRGLTDVLRSYGG